MIEERKGKYLRMISLDCNIKEVDGSKDVQGVFSQIKREIDAFLI